ncbi:MAG: hypothetical protein COX41_02400 [Candidatus Omnitrophica bacterium CG23_combo_of_CG06-09_8_20_14_all_41_10]|uniref:Uncharacterized protein n=1 Tax=Candidatus Sherwoodlollariibacterium unditelluris TaxID=1974757 RepID=A0A2G9YJY3_9BACT|nr:MAG: hypothetical protein COX41_02400 [Candidatus Omnitrophica bacterium CG23_combo_of_CG06-09_8_20_14_all_41_10]
MSWNKQGRVWAYVLFLSCVLFSFLYLLPARAKILVSGPKKTISSRSRSLTVKPVKEGIEVFQAKAGMKKKYKVAYGTDEVEVGDFSTQKFKPQAKLKRWGEETFLQVGVSQVNISAADETVDLQADRVGWESPKVGAGFYKTDQREIKVKGKNNKDYSVDSNC